MSVLINFFHKDATLKKNKPTNISENLRYKT